MPENQKWICKECDWHGLEEELLRAPNPFLDGDTLWFCPECRQSSQMVMACDEPGCWERVACGTPTAGGYRTTCGRHVPVA